MKLSIKRKYLIPMDIKDMIDHIAVLFLDFEEVIHCLS